MKNVIFTGKYKNSMKDVRKYPEYNAKELEELINKLANGEKLDDKYRDHAMSTSSSLKGVRGFHLRGNLVILYRMSADTLEMLDIGKHNKIRLTSSL